MALDNRPFQTPKSLIGRMNMVTSGNSIVDILLGQDKQPIANITITGILKTLGLDQACVIANGLEKVLQTGKSSALELGLTSHYVLSEDKKTLDLRFIDPQSPKNSETAITLSRVDGGVFTESQIDAIRRSFVIPTIPGLSSKPTVHP